MKEKKSQKIVFFHWLYCMAICLGGGLVFGRFLDPLFSLWYPEIKFPPGTPPSSFLVPLWVVLYTLIATSLFLFWRAPNIKEKPKGKTLGFTLFAIQLFINLTWPFCFFVLETPFLGVLNVTSGFVILFFVMRAFYPYSKAASFLLLPYFLWTLYDIPINIGLWILNR